jgi:hypothetical protein
MESYLFRLETHDPIQAKTDHEMCICQSFDVHHITYCNGNIRTVNATPHACRRGDELNNI